MLYGPNVNILFSGAMLRVLGQQPNGAGGPYTIGMTIYAGTAPTPDQIVANWSAYNSTTADYLVHFTNAQWTQAGSTNPTSLIQITTVPTAVAAVRSGTATWAILWAGQPSGGQLSGTTLPFSNFLVVNVSDQVGDGVVRFSSTTFTSGVSVSVFDGTFSSLFT